MTAQYVLPAGGMQAVRAQFRYQSSNAACASGSYNDHDDLVFSVEPPGGGCTLDSECDDGAYCNGAETCNVGTGECEAGTAVSCDDGVSCTVDSCNETTDSCDYTANDGLCGDGLQCNGIETCDAVNDCQPGSDPCPGQSCNETDDVCEAASGSVIWMSFRGTTTVPGVGTVRDEDLVSYDESTGAWAFQFDGSDVGVGGNEIDGFAILPGGDLLMSFRVAGTVGSLSFDDSDVLRFTGTLGTSTSGSFSMYFDGSDVGLTSNGEDVDGVALATDGRLIVSTQGGFSGTGASGADEDLFLFTGTLGASTSGSFSQYFDGSDVGLGGNGSEDVDAASLTVAGNLLFSTVGSFSVTGLSGDDEDIAEFAGTFGNSTSGTFSLRQDLTALGVDASEDVGSLHIVE